MLRISFDEFSNNKFVKLIFKAGIMVGSKYSRQGRRLRRE